MTTRRALMLLIGAQLRYRRSLLLWLLVGVTTIIVPSGFMLENSKRVAAIWSGLILITGVLTAIILWGFDQKERRPLAWIHMPVEPSRLSTARILSMVITVTCAFLPMPAVMAARRLAGLQTSEELISSMIAAHALTLFLVLVTTSLSEEVTVWACRFRRRGKVILILGWLVAGFTFSYFYKGLESTLFLRPLHIATLLYIGSLAVSILATRLYTRRRSYLVGANPHHGFPEDWSSVRNRA